MYKLSGTDYTFIDTYLVPSMILYIHGPWHIYTSLEFALYWSKTAASLSIGGVYDKSKFESAGLSHEVLKNTSEQLGWDLRCSYRTRQIYK